MYEPLWWLDRPVCLEWRTGEVRRTSDPFRRLVKFVRGMGRGMAVVRGEVRPGDGRPGRRCAEVASGDRRRCGLERNQDAR